MATKIGPTIPMHAVLRHTNIFQDFYYSLRCDRNEWAQLHFKSGVWHVFSDDKELSKLLWSKIYKNRELPPNKRNVKRLLRSLRSGYMTYFHRDMTSFASAIAAKQSMRSADRRH